MLPGYREQASFCRSFALIFPIIRSKRSIQCHIRVHVGGKKNEHNPGVCLLEQLGGESPKIRRWIAGA